jgi:VIT1/CCC1 family predicted Fe2+/Mn2+ transporter
MRQYTKNRAPGCPLSTYGKHYRMEAIISMHPNDFARDEYRSSKLYAALAVMETEAEFKHILETIAGQEESHHKFWLAHATVKEFSLSPFAIPLAYVMRKIFGLTFTLKFLERGEDDAIDQYRAYLSVASPEIAKRLQQIIADEESHEQEFLGRIKEDRVDLLGNIVLGLNDGLIELTGALVGFASAFANPRLVALAGSITGISATLSMAASAYMQARAENRADARKRGVSTGIAYLLVVTILVLPFLLFPAIRTSLAVMATAIVIIVSGISYYAAVIFERSFFAQAREMFIFSIGVAFIAFCIGTLVRNVFGIDLGA